MTVPDNGISPLTPRECRALELSATGLVIAEVADAMGVSPQVVREWLASAIAKLGARSKLEAIIIALQRGLIDLSRAPDAGRT